MVQTRINKILFLALCVGYSSTLYTAQHDVDDEKEQSADNKLKQQEIRIIKRLNAQKPSFIVKPLQLPKKGDHFTGRQQKQTSIAAFFGAKRKKSCAFQVITGMGGTGKTSLALHYAHACAKGAKWVHHRYDAILWLYADKGLDSQFHELAKVCGKKDCKTAQQAVKFVYMALQKKNRTLLVLDNVKESDEVDPYLPSKDQKGLLDILITTRNPALDLPRYSKFTYITLDVFTREESKAYTQKVLGHKKHSQQDMDALCDSVSDLPVALSYALQYIKKEKYTLAKYPAYFAEHQLRLGTQMQASPLVASFLLPVLTLKEKHPIIEPLLVTAAHLAPKRIPIIAVSTAIDKRETQKALSFLHEYGLLTLAEDYATFDIHRLVQQVLREWHLVKSGPTGVHTLLKDWMTDFQPLLEKGRPKGGSSTDIQYFREAKSGGLWIGKCNINAFVGANNDEEYREALGLAMYRFFGIITPDFAVSVQPVAPSVYVMFPPGDIVSINKKRYYVEGNRPCIHIMTQFLDGFSTCEDAFKKDAHDEHKDEEKEDQKAPAVTYNDSPFMCAYKQAAKKGQPFYLQKNGKKYPLKGLGSMLALANFIYDMDCIGKSGGNLGYLIKGNHAQVVKIDPGCAFSFLEDHTNKKFHHNPMDRKTFFGTDESATLGYSQLTPADQQAFAAMATHILKIPRVTLKQLIDSVVVKGGWSKEKADGVLNRLVARKFLFLKAFSPEIDDKLRKEIMDAKHRLVTILAHKKGAKKQSKAQIEAYKKTLKELREWETKVATNSQAKKPSFAGKIFQLPEREKGVFFTGRQKERASMSAFFGGKRKKSCAFQGITGLGGMGKTQLAVHYAHACADGEDWVKHHYDTIIWLYVEGGLESQFHKLSESCGKSYRIADEKGLGSQAHEIQKALKKKREATQKAIAFVYSSLQKRTRTLLVFDNVEQSEEISLYLPPPHQKGVLDIIMTTRNPDLDLPHHGKPAYITLSTFTKEEGRTCIQKVLSNKGCNPQAMDALWETVNGLPLTLNHALQYIAKGKCTLAEYPARFAEHQLRIGSQLQESPVVTSVLLSVLLLREEHPIIEPLLVTAAHLNPDKIYTTAVSTAVDAEETKQALVVLHKYGLLTLSSDGQTFRLHRLVQQVLREWYLAKSGPIGVHSLLKDWTIEFQPLQKKGRPPGGSSTDIQYFREVKTGNLWIGKCNIKAYIGASNDEEYREALGLAIYRFFGIITPEFAVSVQPVAPSVYRIFPHGQRVPVGNKTYLIDKNRPCMHIMTQFLEGFSTCGDAFKEDWKYEHKDDQKDAEVENNDSPFMCAYKRAAKMRQPFCLVQNGKKYPLKGLGSMLALANFIYDMDCIGRSGGNLGYLIKGNHAQVVKIDPGCAFSFLENHTNKKFHHNPMDRKTFFGIDERATLGYDQLTPVDQQAFAAMAKRILQTPRKTLKQLIDSVVVAGGWQQQMGDKLLNHLIARKSLFLAAFAPEIDDNLRKDTMDAKHRLVSTLVHQKGPQQHSKAQIAAYQKALKDLREWGAKVAANRLVKQKDPKNNQAQKPVFGELFQLPAKARGGLFTGRQQERAAMAAFFGTKRKKACAFQAITGVGGMGKTHLALHYVHACTDGVQWVPHRYNAILWFYAEAGLDSQFHELAKAWKKECKTAQEAVQFVYQALQKKNRTLLVFDNAQQSQEIAPYLPPLHQKGLLDIIFTTRNPALNLPHYGKPTYITLGAFTKEEGRLYIQKVLGHKGHSQQAMDALWETVSGLPLALNYALEYIAKGKCTLEKYPARFAKHQLSLGAQLQASPVVTSVLLSVLTLREQHPLIEPLLVTAAYLAPEKVPTATVFTLLGAKITKQTKQQALAVLHKYGLLTLAKDRPTFDFHRLVQQVLREWHLSKKGQAGHEALLKDWIAYFKKNLKYDDRDLKAIYRIIPLIPHAYAIADADSTSAAIEKAQAALYCQVGYHQCFGVGDYDRAKQCYQKALTINEKHYGAHHPQTAHTMQNLGTVLRNLGDYTQAKAYFEKAFKIQEKHYGADHPTTAMTIENLGTVLRNLGDYAQAKQCYQKALKTNEQHYGATHPQTASTMGNLGNVLADLGDYAQAMTYLQKALKINTQHYGIDHPETAGSMQNLGSMLRDLGDYAEAKAYYEKALKINTQHYGAHHPSTAQTMENLGSMLRNLGDYALAKQYLEKALKINTQHYGADHPSTARTMRSLGGVHCALAQEYYKKALKIDEKHYGADHPRTARTMGHLGNLCQHLGQYARAREYYQQNIKVFTKHYGTNHSETKRVKRLLATLKEDLIDGEKDVDADNSYTLFDYEDISLDVLAHHLKNTPTFTAWLQYMHENECDTDILLYTLQDKIDDNILYDSFKGDKNILLEVTNFIEKKEKTKPEAKKTKKHAKSTLDNPLNQVRGKPNKMHKQPKHASGPDEKENDTEDNTEIASSKQPLMWGQIDQLHHQLQPNEEKENESQDDDVFDID